MNPKIADLLMSYASIKCLLCEEQFRTRIVLRHHLKREHTEEEAEKYVNDKNHSG